MATVAPQCRRKYGAADGKGSRTETTLEVKPDYDLHIKVQAEVRSVLRDSAELAYKMGGIPKPDLVDLMNLFIGWGLTIQKKIGLNGLATANGCKAFVLWG